jgi:hypothetical protein
MATFFNWLYGTAVASTVRDSLFLTGALSALHLLGFTLITGGSIVSTLRLFGIFLRSEPVITVTRPAARGVAVGLVISVATGALLFAARAPAASINRTFQIKMLLLFLAVLFQFTVHRVVTRREIVRPITLRAIGGAAILLWGGVAAAGCYYILLSE